jgi:hypothetical protein
MRICGRGSGGLEAGGDLEVVLAGVAQVQDVEFLLDESDAAIAVGAIDAVLAEG